MSKDQKHPSRTGRRRFLKALGAGIAVPFGTATVGARGSDSGRTSGGSFPEAFRVRGTQTLRTEITPDALVRHERKSSPALQGRYGSPVVEKTERIERIAPAEDPYPERQTVTETLPWDTHFATEAEWEAFFTSASSSDVTIASHIESDYPYGIWEYNQLEYGYEKEGPMNVISPETIPDVAGVLDSNGWTLAVVQHDRWAWNSDTNQFEKQHKSAATGTFGFLGRKHMRMWEFGGYVSGSAHIDSDAPHRAISFDDAEQAVEEVFDDESGWSGFEDYYYLNNDGFLDHDGYATELYKY